MDVVFGSRSFTFSPWKRGRLGGGAIAFDTETEQIKELEPPRLVIAVAFDGKRGVFITPDLLAQFVKVHSKHTWVLHNAAFDLAVINKQFQQEEASVDIYNLVDKKRVFDTMLLHQLICLANNGHVANRKGESTLENIVKQYLAVELPKDIRDSEGADVRLNFGKWIGRSPRDIDSVYLDYTAKDAVGTWHVYQRMRGEIKSIQQKASEHWGFVSEEWLAEQWKLFGPLTHHTQLRASIVLDSISRNGMRLDTAASGRSSRILSTRIEKLKGRLLKYGFQPEGKGSQKALQAILRRLALKNPEVELPKTETGKFASDKESLDQLSAVVPFAKTLCEYRNLKALQTTFINKLHVPDIHPSFRALAVTGRTSSFGEINSQNLPATDEIRSLFIPSNDHVFIGADFKTIELASFAEAITQQFSWPSEMAKRINAGEDLHRFVASKVLGIPTTNIKKADRQKAKAVNFGLPGGMGPALLQRCARTKFNVNLSDEEATNWIQAWKAIFPEAKDFLSSGTIDVGQLLAEKANLTNFPSENRSDTPNAILGRMALKVLRDPLPVSAAGNEYSVEKVDFLWKSLAEIALEFPASIASQIQKRAASPKLWRAVKSRCDRMGVFTLTGRLRGNASYAARHNTIFQGLTADGAKCALWRLWRNGFRIVNFVHDEVLIEVSESSDLTVQAATIKRLMVAGMKRVIKTVKVDVDYAASRRWYKSAEAAFVDGKLQLWEPAPVNAKPTNTSRVKKGSTIARTTSGSAR